MKSTQAALLVVLLVVQGYTHVQGNLQIAKRLVDNIPHTGRLDNALKTHSGAAVVAAEQQSLPAAGTSTVSSSIFNLAKTILGAGVLSLPSGIAAFTDKPDGLLPASGILVLMGILSAYSFSSIGKACKVTNSKSIKDAWSKSTQSPRTANFVSFLITFKTFFACMAYSIIIGDSFTQISHSFGANPAVFTRTNMIVGLSSFFVLPLCLLKNLDALKYTSMLGLGGILYTGVFMAMRMLDGSYQPGGKYFSLIDSAMRPTFGVRDNKGREKFIFKLVSMMATAYMAHYNAPKFLSELKEPTMDNFNQVVGAAFVLAFVAYLAIMSCGFMTFGGSSTGFILNNYASADNLATLARIAIGGGVLCGYPLTFSALRDGIFDLTGINSQKWFAPMTVLLLAVLTQLAIMVRNVGSVLSFSGALIGSAIIFIIPAIMNICNARREVGGGDKKMIAANYVMATFGAIVAVVGVWANMIG